MEIVNINQEEIEVYDNIKDDYITYIVTAKVEVTREEETNYSEEYVIIEEVMDENFNILINLNTETIARIEEVIIEDLIS